MTLPLDGQISLDNVRAELSGQIGLLISLNQPLVRELAEKPTGKISLSDLRGKAALARTTLYIPDIINLMANWVNDPGRGWHRNAYGIDTVLSTRISQAFLSQVRKVDVTVTSYYNTPVNSLSSNCLLLITNKRTVKLGTYDGMADPAFGQLVYTGTGELNGQGDVIAAKFSYTLESDEVLQNITVQSGGYTSAYPIGVRGMDQIVFHGPTVSHVLNYTPHVFDLNQMLASMTNWTYNATRGWYRDIYGWNTKTAMSVPGMALADIRKVSVNATGYHNTPAGALGESYLFITTNKRSVTLGTVDGNTTAASGHAKHFGDEGLFIDTVDVVNRVITFTLDPDEVMTNLQIASTGYADNISYPFSLRGLKDFTFFTTN